MPYYQSEYFGTAVQDVKNYEEQEETLALLKILALGNCEVEQVNSAIPKMCALNWTNNEQASRHAGIGRA